MPLESIVFFTDRDLGARFPQILSDGGSKVRRHQDLFPPDCPDELWLQAVARNNWIAITHDTRIRYKPNELAAVRASGARLLVVIGKAPYPELARYFLATAPSIVDFVEQHPSPWIAKVYRPSPWDLKKRPNAPGSVSLWYSESRA